MLGIIVNHFGTISEIEISEPSTWSNKIFLTFDTDWAHEQYISGCLDLLEIYKAKSTWFITDDFKHKRQLLNRMEQSDHIEIAIHPNFNPSLIENRAGNRSPEEIVKELLELAPSAKAVRSHALTQNTRLSKIFWDLGLKYECNTLIPEDFGIIPAPWVTPTKITHVPHIWADDFACASNFDFGRSQFPNLNGRLSVFDFHPIHVFLNSKDISIYEETRNIHQNPKLLSEFINTGAGTKNFLRAILEQEL